jgi:hypothetical protein
MEDFEIKVPPILSSSLESQFELPLPVLRISDVVSYNDDEKAAQQVACENQWKKDNFDCANLIALSE